MIWDGLLATTLNLISVSCKCLIALCKHVGVCMVVGGIIHHNAHQNTCSHLALPIHIHSQQVCVMSLNFCQVAGIGSRQIPQAFAVSRIMGC